LLKFAEESGITPKALENRPKLSAHLQYGYKVFWELSETRQSAFAGINRLSLAEFNHYCFLNEIQRQEAQDLWWQISTLDRAFKAYMQEKAEKKPA